MVPFSVLMSVYRNDKAQDLVVAFKSIYHDQTIKPTEIILVVDGPVPDILSAEIKKIESQVPVVKVLWQEENRGLGIALRIGMENVSNELVARMDSDDISLPNRFEKQLLYMAQNPSIAVCGGQITEFIGEPDNIVARRTVPLNPNDCRKYYRDRDPLNHMTVMFRRNAVVESGNYQPWHLDEDTYLWGRILEKGYKISNLPDVLVNVRVGQQMYARRGGWKYFKSDTAILKWKLDHKLTGRRRYLYNYVIRFIVQVAMPNGLRGWFFKHCLRK